MGGNAPVLASERQGTGNDFGSFWESYEMKNEWRRGKFRKWKKGPTGWRLLLVGDVCFKLLNECMINKIIYLINRLN